MRSSLLPGMIDALKRNMLVDEFDLRFFEVGRVFQRKSGDQTLELNRLSLGMTGRGNPNNWRRNSEKFDLFYLKGFIASIGKLWGQNLEFRAGTREALHPSQQLEVRCGGHFLGHFGMIHPRYLDNKKFPHEIFLAEIDLGLLADQPRTHVRVQPIPEIPAIRRDLALVVPVESAHEELISCIRKEGGKLLENCSLFDVYQGKGVETGKKSMAFSLTFRGHERTLTDEEVQPIVDSMIAQAGRQFKAKLSEG